MKELQMEIKPETNCVVYQGRQLVGMETPSPLASQISDTDQHETTDETHSVSPIDAREKSSEDREQKYLAHRGGEGRGDTGNPRQTNEKHYSKFPMEFPCIFGAQKGQHISPSHILSAS